MLIAIAGTVSAQTSLGGEVGTDLGIQGFNNTLDVENRRYDVDRRLSQQFLGLRFSGPLKTRNLAELSLNLRLTGTYNKVLNDADGVSESFDEYIDPRLDQVMASVGLFPLRTYPLRYTFSRMEITANRYEPQRRGDTELPSPGLAVIRRYDTETLSHRLQWQAALPREIAFSADARHEERKINRQYDLDENRDIWIVFTTSVPDPSPTHEVDVFNSLDDRVILFIDLALVDTLAAGESVALTIEKGVHEIDVVPTRFNRFNTTVDVQSNMQWRIVFTPPQGSTDQDQTADSVEGLIKNGESARIGNELRFLFSDQNEDVQGTTSSISNLDNKVEYEVKNGIDLTMQTTYTGTSNVVRNISSQDINSLLHRTEGRLRRTSGASASLAHSFNRIETITASLSSDPSAPVTTPPQELNSNTNIFTGRGTLPTGLPGDHVVDARATGTLLSDNKGYRNDQYMGMVSNKFEIRTSGWRLNPRHEARTTYSITDLSTESDTRIGQESSASKTTETESRLQLDAERVHMGFMDSDLRIRSEWGWRLRDVRAVQEIKNRYFAEVGWLLRVSTRLKVIATISQEQENFSRDVDEKLLGRGDATVTVRNDRTRHLYRMDVQAEPLTGLSLGVNGSLVQQNGTENKRLIVSLSGRVPRVNMPIRSFLISEVKSLEGLDDQKLLQWEMQTNYRFRRITLTVSYALFSETLIAEDYSYSEFYVKLSRAFDLM